MGNSLSSNPTHNERIIYAEKIGKTKPKRAIEIYQDIIYELRLQKKRSEAIDILLKISKLQLNNEKAISFIEIANLYNKLSVDDLYLQDAIFVYENFGEFSNCGKLSALIAEKYEGIFDNKNAIVHYEKSIDYYQISNSEGYSNHYMVKLATLLSLDPELIENAILMFEKIAQSSVKNKLTIHNASEHLFRAGLCRLVKNSLEDAKKAIEIYSLQYPIFSFKREATFLNMLIHTLEKSDIDGFNASVIDYNDQYTIDNWTSTMLLNIKKTISTVELV